MSWSPAERAKARRLTVCQHIAGALRNWEFPSDYENVFTDDDGRVLSPAEAREYLRSQLAEGKAVLPMDGCRSDCKRAGCTGFDFQSGCPGYYPGRESCGAPHEENTPC